MLRSVLRKGELEFLHDAKASVTCQTCHPATRCLSTSQLQQPRRCTHKRTLAWKHKSVHTLCQMIRLIHMTVGSGVKLLKVCLRKLMSLTSWVVVQHLSSSFFPLKRHCCRMMRASNAVEYLLELTSAKSNDQMEHFQICSRQHLLLGVKCLCRNAA